MNNLNILKNKFTKIPKEIVRFTIKALMIFIVWELLYIFFFLPTRLIDKPLSLFTGKATAVILNIVTSDNDKIYLKEELRPETTEGVTINYLKTTLYKGKKRIIGIADSCNGLNLYVLFIGFIIAYPGTLKTKTWYSLVGLLLIIAVNVLRCAGLAFLTEKYPSIAPVAHHYFYKLIIYALVFYLWVRFIKLQQKITISNA